MQRFDPFGSFSSTRTIRYLCKHKCLHSYRSFVHSQYKYSIEILINVLGWLGRDQGGRGTQHQRVSRKGQVYRPSTLRFIPKGNEVPRVLIHQLSLIFCRHASRLRANSMAMTAMSASSCVRLLKCSATGDSSVFRCVMSYR